jgi:hypothetical protein
MSALRVARAATGRARSSSSSGTTTGTATPCWRPPARAWPPSACRARRGSPTARSPTPCWSPGTTPRRCGRGRRARRRPRRDRVRARPREHEPRARPPGDGRAAGFLQQLRAQADRTGAVLIFDEVISGFRMARGGAQEHYGVTPGPHRDGQDRRRRLPAGGLGRRAASWTSSRRSEASTRPAPCPGTPWRSRPGRRPWSCSPRRVYPRLTQITDQLVGDLRRGAGRRGPVRRGPRDGDPGRCAVRRSRAARQGRRGRRGPRPLRALLPRDARAGRLPRAGGLRDPVHLPGAGRPTCSTGWPDAAGAAAEEVARG